ncbi:hypothetical protein [Pseudonocardia sp. H11422]|uniref:hypothetical protein n=1 Tax=Pseudonocardia sp. H11422 TaxID=2835866 RepID=UPI001BDBC704|nr:hypothetical protein [Pseudonocardia sp. H11422]
MKEFVKSAPALRLPTLIRIADGYRVFDPELVEGTQYSIDDRGTLLYNRLPAGTTILVVLACAVAMAVTLGGGGWGWMALWFVLGIPAGVVVAGMLIGGIHLVNSPERRYRQRTGSAEFSIDVRDRDSAAWRLCETAEAIAATRAWSSGAIDRQRSVPTMLWSAVRRLRDEEAGGDDPGAVEGALAEIAAAAAERDRSSVGHRCLGSTSPRAA